MKQKRLSTNFEKIFMGFFLSSLVLGYAISYSKLYLFHVVCLFYLALLLLNYSRLNISSLQKIWPFIAFLAYSIISIFWAPSLKNALYVLFYFSNALLILLVTTNFIKTKGNLRFCLKILAFFFVLNFLIGLLETTGYFRLPISPYYGKSLTSPSGFNSNLNNFGFVFITIFPFFFVYYEKDKSKQLPCLIIMIWFLIKLESRGCFLGAIVFMVSYFTFYVKSFKKQFNRLILFLLGTVLIALSVFLLFHINLESRIFSTFSAIKDGTKMITTGALKSGSSINLRAKIYSTGFSELMKSPFKGLGAAGIGTLLAQQFDFFGDSNVYSFHNFFLEMLIDYGLIAFLVLSHYYFYLVKKLIKISNTEPDPFISLCAKASALSLITILPTSISPSSIIYVYSFWLIIAISISIINVSSLGKSCKFKRCLKQANSIY